MRNKTVKPLVVSLDEIRGWSAALIDQTFETRGSEIDFTVDYYWTVFQDEIFIPENEPSELGMGQIYDDVDDLRRIVSEDVEPLSHAWYCLGMICIALSKMTEK